MNTNSSELPPKSIVDRVKDVVGALLGFKIPVVLVLDEHGNHHLATKQERAKIYRVLRNEFED